jgi:hypothetical protein
MKSSFTQRVVALVTVCTALLGFGVIAAVPASALSARDFSVRIVPNSVALTAGGSATLRVSVVRGRRFRSALAYRVDSYVNGLSSGVSLSSRGATVSVFAASNAPTTSGRLVVTVTGGGKSRQAVALVRVTGATAAPPVVAPTAPTTLPAVVGDFTVAVDQPILTVNTSATSVLGVFVNPSGGYTGAPSFEVTGLPAGVTGSFVNPSSKTGTNLVITASSAVPRGDYPIVVKGTDGGRVRQVSAVLRVTSFGPFTLTTAFDPVRAAPGGTTTLKVTVNSVGGAPVPEVDLTLGLPAGVTATPATIRTNGTAQFVLTFATGLIEADYVFNVRGVSGPNQSIVSVAIRVSPKPFVTLTSTDISVTPGGVATYEIKYTPVAGLPTPSLVVRNTPANANNVILTSADGRQFVQVTTTATTPKGVYNMKLDAQSGAAVTSVDFILRVV